MLSLICAWTNVSIETSVIWDSIVLIMTSLKWTQWKVGHRYIKSRQHDEHPMQWVHNLALWQIHRCPQTQTNISINSIYKWPITNDAMSPMHIQSPAVEIISDLFAIVEYSIRGMAGSRQLIRTFATPSNWQLCGESEMRKRRRWDYDKWNAIPDQPTLTHWGRDKMTAFSHTTLSNAFSWMKILEFRLKIHWSLFLRILSTIFQHWFW